MQRLKSKLRFKRQKAVVQSRVAERESLVSSKVCKCEAQLAEK